MRTKARSIIAAVGVTLGLLGLAGCTTSSLPEFDRPQTEADVVEPPSDSQTVESDSTRYIADVDGYSIFIAKMAESNGGLCIVLVDSESGDWGSTSCGGSSGVATTLRTGAVVAVVDGIPPDVKGDREELSESVTVARG